MSSILLGWDDNGLPTERRVQNYYGVLCDPSVPDNPDFRQLIPAQSRWLTQTRPQPGKMAAYFTQ